MTRFSSPLPFLEIELRRHLLSLLRSAVRLSLLDPFTATHLSALRVRSISVYAHAFGLDPLHCTLSDIMKAASVPPTMEELPNLAAITADRFVSYRAHLPPPLDQTGFSLTSWNTTAVSVQDKTPQGKVHALHKLVNSGIVLIQESKLTEEDAAELQSQLTHTLVLHTPTHCSDPQEQDKQVSALPGRSGGVAFLIPTYLHGNSFVTEVITPHYALALSVPLCGYDLHVLNVYFPPAKEGHHLARVLAFLRANSQPGVTILAGDVNQVRKLPAWQSFLAEFDLVDLATINDAPSHTFKGPKGWSSLDTVCVSTKLLDENGWTADLKALPRQDDKVGHLPLVVRFRPPCAAKHADLAKYQRLPDDAFKQVTPAGHNLSTLLKHYLSQQSDQSPFSVLQTTNAFYQAFATTFPRQRRADPAYLLRQSANSNKVMSKIPLDTINSYNDKVKFPICPEQFHSKGPDHVLLPKRVRDDMLRIFNDWEALQRDLNGVCSLRASLMGQPRSLKVWERFRMLSPKATGALTTIQDSTEQFHTHPRDIARTVLEGREFWTEAPPEITEAEFAALLPEPHTLSTPNLASEGEPNLDHPLSDWHLFPSVTRFSDILAVCGNTSPGIDGIPYAAYRTDIPFASQLLHSCLGCICANDPQVTNHVTNLPTPHQLLVWIPKAVAGPTPNNWRPLSMPLVYDRLMDKVVFASAFPWFASKLHPAQSLISQIKEPQYNYLEAQTFLQQASGLSAALLVDLAKAFERVNVQWLLRLLQHYNAPRWLIKYVHWTLSNRVTTPKIRGHLTEPLIPLVGLDMGRACSVLLFCLSIDPMIRLLSKPTLSVLRAYMDDTTLAKAGLTWIKQAQESFLRFQSVGIVIEQHCCCKILPTQQSPSFDCPGLPTWKQAAAHVLSHSHHLRDGTTYTVPGTTLTLTVPDLLLLANAAHPTLLCMLMHIPCKCKAKTTIVPSCQLTPTDLCTLDDTPFGMHVLKQQDTTLGLPLASKHRNILPFAADGLPLKPCKFKLGKLAHDALAKATLKLTQRARRIQATLTSLPKRALFWTAYCQSTLYYVTSIFILSPKQMQKIQRLQQKVLLGRAWIPHKILPDVLSSLKIAPCNNLHTSTNASLLGAALRLVGTAQLLLPSNGTMFFQNVHRTLLAWQKSDPTGFTENFLNKPVPPPENRESQIKAVKQNINRILLAYKTFRKKILAQEATNYVLNKAHFSPFSLYTQGNVHKLLEVFSSLPHKLLPPVDKAYFLRWLVNEELDLTYHMRLAQHSKLQQCVCGCGQKCRQAPLGHYWGSACPATIDRLLPAAPWQLRMPTHPPFPSLEECQLRYSSEEVHNARQVAASFPQPGDLEGRQTIICPLCHLGDASTEHWLVHCPAVGMAFTAALQRCWHPDLLLSHEATPTQTAQIIKLIAQLRRTLLTTNVLHPNPSTTSPVCPSAFLCLTHQQTTHIFAYANKLLQACQHTPSPQTATYNCNSDTAGCPCLSQTLLRFVKPALLSSIPMANHLKNLPHLACKVSLRKGETAAILDEHDPRLSLLLTPGPASPPLSRNLPSSTSLSQPGDIGTVEVRPLHCHCGQTHFQLVAQQDTHPNTRLTSTLDSQNTILHQLRIADPSLVGRYLLVQSDGSFVRNKHSSAGGSGHIIWDCCPTRNPLPLAFLATADSTIGDSMHAEAHGFSQAAQSILDLHDNWRITNPVPQLKIVFQLDNLPIVQYLNKQAKCTHRHAANLVSSAHTLLAQKTAHVTVEYIPREANVFADQAAGFASQELLEQTEPNPGSFSNFLPLPFLQPGTSPTVKFCPDGTTLRLPETPAVNRPLFLHFLRNNPRDLAAPALKLGWQYYHTLFTSTPPVETLEVTYHKARGERFYAKAPAAQQLPSKLRLFLFGSTHVELDMIAAQMQIFVFAVTGSLLVFEKTVSQLRDHFQALLSIDNHRTLPPQYVKQLFNVFLNTSAGKVIDMLQRDFFFVPQEILGFFRSMEALRPNLLSYAASRGFQEQNSTPANRMYFALEFLEQQFLQTFTANLCTQIQITSLIYVHDGLYCAPAPSQEQLRHIALLTTQQLQLPYFPVKMIDLAPEWQQLYGYLRTLQNTSSKNAAQAISHHHKHVTTVIRDKRKSHVLSDQQYQPSIANYFQKKFKLSITT